MSPGSTHEADFKLPKRFDCRIVHGELYEPTLLFIGDLRGPAEIETTPGFNYVPCIAKPTN